MENEQKRIDFLANLVAKAKQAYYFSGQEIMTDAEYDALEEELRSVSPGHPILQSVGAPLAPGAGHLSRVKHRRMMGSQSKVNTEEEFDAWGENRGADKFHVSLKADGCSIAAYYEDGRLEQVVTRGDGVEGENVTANAYSFKNLPTILPEKISCAVRLEVVLTVTDWRVLDPEAESNPRSLANGILGRKDGKNAGFLTALAFDVEGVDAETEEEKSLWLERNGFTHTVWGMAENRGGVSQFMKDAQQKRDAGRMEYWADGIVAKINDLARQDALGVVSGRPKGQVAWKFNAEVASSVLEEVEWTVGHTGAITPVAKVAAVRLGGTTVRKVSLSNPELIEAMDLSLGSRVEVIKAGDIIPKITRVLERGPGERVKAPCTCPACDAALKKLANVDGGETAVIYCSNGDCEAQTTGRILRWAKSRDVLGLGSSVVEGLRQAGLVNSVSDLFKLKAEDIQHVIINPDKKIRLGEKRAESIVNEINSKGTEMGLAEFLGSFGTRKLGVRRATLMIEANTELSNIERWFDGSLADEEFAAKAGVPNAGKQILEGLKEREAIIRESLGHITLTETGGGGSEKSGKTICITGVLPSGKKKAEWGAALEGAGYILVDTVTKDLYALVVSDPSKESTKSRKAKALGVKIISEDEMAAICRGDGGKEAAGLPRGGEVVGGGPYHPQKLP